MTNRNVFTIYLVSKADRGLLRWLFVNAGINRSWLGPEVGLNDVNVTLAAVVVDVVVVVKVEAVIGLVADVVTTKKNMCQFEIGRLC